MSTTENNPGLEELYEEEPDEVTTDVEEGELSEAEEEGEVSEAESEINEGEFGEESEFEEEEEELNEKILNEEEEEMFNEEESETESEDEEDNLQKIDESVKRDYIKEYHSEIITQNSDEIEKLCVIVRNDKGRIEDVNHKTVPFVTKYECARILGERAKQLNTGDDSYIEVPENIIDGYTIAGLEYEQKAIPFIVRRPMPDGSSEYWKFADLEQIIF